MGIVKAEITLKNANDCTNAKLGLTTEKEIREMTVTAVVDTGAWTLVISEAVREKLGLELHGDDWVTLANGVTESVKKVDPVQIHWKNRNMICQPILIPGADEVLLGAVPLEEMDLIVDPRNEEIVGRHGERTLRRL